MVFGHSAVIERSPIQLVPHTHHALAARTSTTNHAPPSTHHAPPPSKYRAPPARISMHSAPPPRISMHQHPLHHARTTTHKVYAVSAISGLLSWHKDSLLQNGGFELYDQSLSDNAVNVGTSTTDALSGTMLGWESSGTAEISETKSGSLSSWRSI